jgi:hypothetical protein
MTRALLGLLALCVLAAACGRTLTAPRCVFTFRDSVVVVRNAAGDSVTYATIRNAKCTP